MDKSNDQKQQQSGTPNEKPDNQSQQAVDKAPGDGRGEGEKVTTEDLKGKKVDRDLTDPKDAPSH